MKTIIKSILLPLVILACMSLTSCEDILNRCVDGNGLLTTETRAMETFDKIQIIGDFEVQIDTNDGSSVAIKADENLQELIITHVAGNNLIIEPRNNDCLRPSRPIEITVNTPTVHEIRLIGSGYINCDGMESDELKVILEGSGQIYCDDIQATSVSLDLLGSGFINCHALTENLLALLEGSGEIRISGESVNSDLKITGSGRINADQINTDVCLAYISGSGSISTWVNNVLNVTIIGSGTVYYTGNPTIESYISGSGQVIHQ